ncbi:MAG: type II toxin-antitoxin system VapC family toxin [Euzebya sp.]
MIFVDSNVPMYLVGTNHPNKSSAQQVLETLVSRSEILVTDAEVLQEILHRYQAIRRPEAIQPAFDALLNVVDEVLPITLPHVEAAKEILLGGSPLSARDALHVAVMETHGIAAVVTFDTGFDSYPGIHRLS